MIFDQGAEALAKRHAMSANRCMQVLSVSTYPRAQVESVKWSTFKLRCTYIGNPGDLVNKVLVVGPSSANVEQAVLRIYN